jgi:probable phosphoglycerate mutase
VTALLHLVRHAHAVGSDTDDPSLSGTGRAQADALGNRLARVGASSVLHSPRRRAAETATRVAAKLGGIQAEVSDLLDDRTPVPSPQHHAAYPQEYFGWLAGTPTDEQDLDGQHISHAASQLAATARAADGPVIAITHAFVIAWIVQTSLRAPAAAWLTLSPANAGLTTFDCTNDSLQVMSYNDTGHLRPH